MGYFDDLPAAASSGGFFDDIPSSGEPTARPMPKDVSRLPGLWNVNVGGQQVRGIKTAGPDGGTVYAVALPDGGAASIQRRKDTGELFLKPMARPTGSNGLLRDVRDAALGEAQGLADIAVNAPARLVDTVVNGGGRLIDRGLNAIGIDTSGTPSLDELTHQYLGTAPSLDSALANQNASFRAATNDSQAGRVGRAAGEVVGTIPLAEMRAVEGATFAPRLANGAVQGGASGGVISASQPDVRGGETAAQVAGGGLVGAAANAFLPPLVRAGAGILRPILPPLTSALQKEAPAIAADATKQARIAAEGAGLSWDALGEGLRNKLTQEIAQARQVSDKVPLDAVVRKVIYESQGLTPTRGMVTRNWEDAWKEQNLMTEPEGDPLRQVYLRNNAAIRDNLQGLAPDGLQPLESPAFGEKFRGDLRANERTAAGQVNQAYNAAHAAEGGRLFDTQPLVDHLQQNLPMLNATNAGRPVIAYLQKMGVISLENMQPIIGANGQPGAGFKALPITMKEAVGLRKVVNDAWTSAKKAGDDTAAGQLNEMRQILNRAEQQAGGDLYKQARQLRQAKGNAFENNPLIDKLLSQQKGYNANLIEDSQVFDKAIVKSSPEQFRALWSQVSGDSRAQTQAQLSKYLEDIAFSNQARNEAGDVVASAARLDRAVKDIGPQKLRMIFGEQRANDLMMLTRSLGEISNPPKGTIPQGSAPKLAFLSRALLGVLSRGSALPSVLGDTMSGAAALIKRGADAKNNGIQVRNAIDLLGPYAEEAANNMALARTRGVAPGASIFGANTARERVKKR